MRIGRLAIRTINIVVARDESGKTHQETIEIVLPELIFAYWILECARTTVKSISNIASLV